MFLHLSFFLRLTFDFNDFTVKFTEFKTSLSTAATGIFKCSGSTQCSETMSYFLLLSCCMTSDNKFERVWKALQWPNLR
jgi:hypothetical protein